MTEDQETSSEPTSSPTETASPAAVPDSGDRAEDRAGQEPGELVLAMSPRQIIGGFALLAGLILMLRRRTRRKG
jgi:hypothetical protein